MKLKEIYTCDHKDCKKYLVNPIALPCGHSICQKHISSSDIKKLKCDTCNKVHLVPEEGFQINLKLSNIINYNLHLNGKHKEVKEMFDKLNIDILNIKKSELANPDVYLNDYFSNLKTQVDVHRDELIKEIKSKSDELIRKLNELQEECKENKSKLEAIDLDCLKKPEWEDQLNDPNISDEKIIEIENEIKSVPDKLDNKVKLFKNEIIMKRTICFKPADDKSFGYFEIKSHKVVFYYNGHYEGEFMSEKKHGTGTFFWKTGHKYIGDWQEDKRTGKGIYVLADGEKYEGEFLNGEFHGRGVYYYKNGEKKEEGTWKNGSLV